MRKMLLFQGVICLFLFTVIFSFAQSPGGVATGLVSWYKQDPNNTNTLWKNALNTGDATGSTNIVYNTTVNNDIVNFNESYTFSSGSFTLPAALDISNSYSIFGVARLKTAGSNGRVFNSALSNVTIGYYNNNMNAVYYDGSPNSLTLGTNSVVRSTTDVKQYTYIRNAGPYSFYGNSTNILSGATSGATAFRGTIGGAGAFTEYSNVTVPEYITYNSALSAVNQNKVESYLALKYGYTKNGDYVNSAENTYWTSTAGYNNNIFGIGRDDLSTLHQKVSKSQNQENILTLATNSDFNSLNSNISRTTINNDLNFLMIGDNNESVYTRVSSDLMSGFSTRLKREWMVQNTDFTQDVNLRFSVDNVTFTWHLIWDADGDFSTGATDLGVLNANGQISLNASLLSTGYFTLMANLPDSDGDGVIDFDDKDDDNDGIPDTVECPEQFNWTGAVAFSSGNTVASGTIDGIPFTFTSDVPMSSTAGVYNHAVFPASYGVPNNSPTISNTLVSNNVLTFAQPMKDPILVFSSIGNSGLAVPIIFDRPVDVLWSGTVGGSFTIDSPTQITGREGYAIVKVPGVTSSLSFKYTVAESWCNFTFGATKLIACDFDGDGISNNFDLDSDNDGCTDAIEGDENANSSQLVTANPILTVGTGSSALIKNICAGASCVDNQGVPIVVNGGGMADIGADQGQGIGSSQNTAIVPAQCLACYKPAVTAGTPLNTNLGITALGRAGSDGDNWPMVRKGGWIALEAKTKGFVLNRVSFDSAGNPIGIPPSDFVEGMTVYDLTNNCLKIYSTPDNGTTYGWYCMNTQTCPD